MSELSPYLKQYISSLQQRSAEAYQRSMERREAFMLQSAAQAQQAAALLASFARDHLFGEEHHR